MQTMTRAYRNHFSGRCADTGVNVPAREGWTVKDNLGNWIVLSDSAAGARNLQLIDKKKEDNAFGGGRKVGATLKGKTKGLSVADTWAWYFAENERRAATKGSGKFEMPWTDEEISERMRNEFPTQPTTASEPKRVRMWRANYNRSVHSFEGRPVPVPQSQQYLADGSAVSATTRAFHGRGSGVTDLSQVLEQAKAAGAAAAQAALQKAKAELEAESAKRPIVQVNFEKGRSVKVDTKGKHSRFTTVLKRIEARLPVLLVGPTGSGKTHLARQVAEALKLDFTFNSMSEGVSESSLLGRVLPTKSGEWKYEPSPFVKTYRDGGLHLLDEIDAADPNLLVTVNAAIANGVLSLPAAGVEPIKRHKDFVLVAAANTFGNGADRQYVGRNQLDAATMNRFNMGTVEVDYDRDVESSIVESILGNEQAAVQLLAWAWRVRDKIVDNLLRRVMSTRNIEDCAKLLSVDMTMPEVADVYFCGWSKDERMKVA